nr:copia protein [Tanacetum cinerariifolium]
MSMMGEMTFFLGLQVNQSPCGIFINQSKYVLEIQKKYEMESCDPVGTPMEIKDILDLDQNGTLVDATKYHSMIGALMYLTSSRPDIVHSTCLCARYQAKPTEKHLKEVKRIFRYLWGTVNTGLWYTKDSGFELTGFSDADYAGCKDSFKSTSDGAQFLGEKLVSWSSKKQDCTMLSTAEAEYVSLSACCAQVLWMRTQLTDYGFHFDKIPIYCDSKSAIAISCNPVQHSRTKHIAVRYHFIKEHVEKGTIELYFVKTDYQLADIFTKALPVDRFKYLVRRLDQSKYVLEILKKYTMESCDPVGTPMEIKDKLDLDQNGTLVDATKYRSMIGALMYLTSSRPDIVHATCLCARFSDSDYAGCKDSFKSTSGGAQFLGEKLLTDYGFKFKKIPIYCDSKSAIAISCNPVQHSRTKHIAVRYYFIKEHVEKGTIELYFVKTDYQLADIFTKALLADHFNYLVRRLGMRSLSPQELERLAKS